MRIPLIDPIKAVAAQVIVLHHMMLYSSMRGPLEEQFPAIIGFLSDPARYAVQVFLVFSGFLTWFSLQRYLQVQPDAPAHDLQQLPKPRARQLALLMLARYRRLVRPYALALLLACAALVWVQDINPVIELTPADPLQLLAHLLLLHDLLDIPALSAGVWYVAIDFQLYAIALLLLAASIRLGRGNARAAQRYLTGLLGLCTAAALLVFNRVPALENVGFYFFGAYGLGMLAAWAVQSRHRLAGMAWATGLVLLALQIDYRERLWVTLAAVGCLLIISGVRTPPAWLNSRPGQFFQQSSYALFLVHYPMSIVLFALVEQRFLIDFSGNLTAAVLCCVAFNAGAWVLMRADALVYDHAWPAFKLHVARLTDAVLTPVSAARYASFSGSHAE